ncbi:MAG: YdgA family protein [Syntrophobacteraceae bacterium]
MKKILSVFVILCVVVAAGYCGASWWVGAQAQKNYEALLAQKQAGIPQLMEITTKSYERGIFHSTAVISFVLKKPGEAPGRDEALRFTMLNSIQHGPLVLAKPPHLTRTIQPALGVISTSLIREGEVGVLADKVLKQVPELGTSELVTILYLDGSGENFLDVPSFKKKLTDDKGVEFEMEWGGLTLRSRFDIGLSDVSGAVNVPVVDLRYPEFHATVKNLKNDFRAYPGIKGLSVGAMNLSCENVEYKPTDGSAASRLESAEFQSGTGVSGDTITASLLARFGKVHAEGQAYGPFVFELELRKLDAATLAAFQEGMKDLQAQIGVKPDEELKQAFEASYMKLLTGLIAKAPEMELRQLKAVTPWGEFNSHLQVAIAESGASILDNPLLALTSLSASLESAVSERLLVYVLVNSFKGDFEQEREEAPQQAEGMATEKARSVIEGLMSQGFLVREGETLKANASYKLGNLVVNGRQLNLGDLLKTE